MSVYTLGAGTPYEVKVMAGVVRSVERCAWRKRRPGAGHACRECRSNYNDDWRARVFALLGDDGAGLFTRLALDRAAL